MDLRKKKCPKCLKCLLSYPPLKEWPDWKDMSRFVCRGCKSRFSIYERGMI